MGKILTLSGPRGGGKTAVLHGLLERGIKPIAPYATRALRDNELEGRDYRQVTHTQFDEIAVARPMFDVLDLGTDRYGTPWADFEEIIEEEGALRTVNLADKAALKLRGRFGSAVTSLMILPSRWKDIRLQMQTAGIDEDKIEQRISMEPTNLHLLPEFDEIVINRYGELDTTVGYIADLAGKLMGDEIQR